MTAKNKKSKGKIDLLEMPEPERVNMIEKLRQTLRQNIAETKMWNYLLQCETVTINGHSVLW